jgi:hypothetical protein
VKPGRNDPCPCGSGKKYKQCCLAGAAAVADSAAELAWRRIRRAVDDYGFAVRMLRFLEDVYGPLALAEAWDEFMCWLGDDDDEIEVHFEPQSPFIPVFMPWFFHCWTPDAPDSAIKDTSLHDRVPTAVFLERQRGMEPVVRRYLEACVGTPFGFYEILSCERGRGFSAREIFTGEECEVLERSASETLRVHDIMYGQLVRVDDIVMVESCSPIVFPPGRKLEILDTRDEIWSAGTPRGEILRDYELELRELYLDIAERILDPPMPQLQNTDGERLVPHRVVFEIDSPQTAFDALKHLANGDEEAELLESAKRNSSGELIAAELAWKKAGNGMHASWDNTVLGHIRISRKRLTCEVNSAERAARIRQIIEEALGAHVKHRSTTVTSVEREMARAVERQPLESRAAAHDPDAPLRSPEADAQVREMMTAHYDEWVTQKIPALGDQTPLDAVRSAAGRERVVALLHELERDSERLPVPPDPAMLRRLRERLGLVGGGS